MNSMKRRPSSSTPQGATNGTPSGRGPPPPLPLRTPHERLFHDTYGRSASVAAPFNGGGGGSDDAVFRGEKSGGRSYHQDITRSSSQSRQPPLSNGDAAANAAKDGAVPSRRRNSADAIAFQYYAHHHQQRRQRLQESTNQPDTSATPVKLQAPQPQRQDFPNGRGVSTPTTAETRGPPTPSNERSVPPQRVSRQPQHQRGVSSAMTATQRAASATQAPLTPTMTGTPIQNTSTSLGPSPPPREVAAETAELMEGASAPRAWAAQLTASQQEHCSNLMQTLTRLPFALAREMLAAAARQYESHRLLHYYGGVCAPSDLRGEGVKGEEEVLSTASSPSPAAQERQESTRGGRATLLETLQRQVDRQQRTDFSSETPSAKMGESGARYPSQSRGQAQGSTSPARASDTAAAAPGPTGTTSKQRAHELQGNLEGARKSTGDVRRPRNASAGGRAPRQLRSRVMASRVSAARCGCNNASRDGSSAAAVRRSPHPVPEFLRTIKPPHRHGLGGAPPPVFSPSTPHTPAATEAALEKGTAFKSSPLSPMKESRSSPQMLQRGRNRDGSHASSPYVTSQEPVHRVVPVPALSEDAFRAMGLDTPGVELSPGAAAARRVYWEQQQQQQQQRSQSGDPHNFSNFNLHAGDGHVVAPRYPESVSTDNVTRYAPLHQHRELESVSLDDSVLRSDAHFLPSAAVVPRESLEAIPTATAPSAVSGNTTNSPPPVSSHGAMTSLTQQLTPPSAQH
ncbi:hypothetical protein ABB37_01551 [Leptomonas pyrrhocoris]|uniref:Uncharacterized protein n=1 Tax=Leptomonas pyrrhocoris TaxID=157538 RepID=A0A0N0VHI9_LEPPY|nr:hypothetical protein ABB37_01551 [Leptomonas pyrrhocoris]KPA85184.1 hypothetical protein ABB37_01551 [Leptomonas pyrrhocoris]|eukprot:XP_015663623.1 hypothetical protein ABB37_01551 [Leptomonas pyrrhocoris]